jgi:hypothetical protein
MFTHKGAYQFVKVVCKAGRTELEIGTHTKIVLHLLLSTIENALLRRQPVRTGLRVGLQQPKKASKLGSGGWRGGGGVGGGAC